MSRLIDIKGKTFGRLLVTKLIGKDSRKESLWECSCDCGAIVTVRSSSLRYGRAKSCGCFRADKAKAMFTTHGGCSTRLYNIWARMLARCRDKRLVLGNGQRNCWLGVTVCDEWLSFGNFKDWATSHGYTKHLSIDRVNGSNIYSPETCKWSDRNTQSANRSISHTKKGKFLGVHKYNNATGRFFWQVMFNKKIKHCGPYDLETTAAKARDNYILANKIPNRLNFKGENR